MKPREPKIREVVEIPEDFVDQEFILPKEEGRKMIDQLAAGKKYEARIRFRIERERDIFGQGWRYLARINSVELLQTEKKN